MAQVVYKPLQGEDLAKADAKAQWAHLEAFISLNPTAVLTPHNIAEGALHPFLRKRTGKRATIMGMLTKPISFIALRNAIDEGKLGGNTYTDVLAAVYGGFTRSASTYGTCYLKVVATK
jgi:hypothetical protein